MLIVTGTFDLDAAQAQKMIAAATAMAHATRAEPGCIEYAFWQDLEHPGRFRVYEEWQDRAALELHFKADHMTVFRAALAEIGPIQRRVVSFDAGPVTAL